MIGTSVIKVRRRMYENGVFLEFWRAVNFKTCFSLFLHREFSGSTFWTEIFLILKEFETLSSLQMCDVK